MTTQADRRNNWRLETFRATGYDRGRPFLVQAAWHLVSPVLMWVFVPSAWRCAILRFLGADIGEGVLIRHRVRIHWPWKLSIGDHSWVGEGTWILNLEQVRIGSQTCLSQDVLLCTGSHDRLSSSFDFDNAPIVVGDRCWVAVRSTVLRGVTIGDDVVIGAASLVTNDIASGTIVRAPRAQQV